MKEQEQKNQRIYIYSQHDKKVYVQITDCWFHLSRVIDHYLAGLAKIWFD